jgi:steroid 5-alpha reductase family enzyme
MSAVTFSLLAGAATVVAIMTLLWGLGVRKRNFSYVDIGWCANFAVLALLYAALGEGWAVRKWLIASMFTIWGLRLALHLARRIIGEPEEGRYVELRRRWQSGGRLNWKFLLFFQFQAALNLILGVPLLIACQNETLGLHPLELAGAAIWLVGVIGEAVADRQLARFKREPSNRGEVCDVGLWRFSRHPNYFFEWTIWIGYAAFALASPWGWIALATPVLMLHFLINVTGVKATEEQAVRSKGEKYRRYQRRTSMFVPLPRRRETISPGRETT